jgi:glucosamine--fructose-6-phosphate aminotransferase (isomerizing)
MSEPDFMLSEMLEQPQIIEASFYNSEIEEISKILLEEDIDQLILTGSGDSYCAAWYGAYLAKKWCPNLNVCHFAPFEFTTYSNLNNLEKTAVIGISVSGGTLRVIEAIRYAKSKGARTTITITDNPEGKLTGETEHHLLIHASPPESLQSSSYESEIAKQYIGYQNDVAQTKTYLGNIAVLSVLMAGLSPNSDKNIKNVRKTLPLVRQAIEKRKSFIKNGENMKESSEKIIFVASGYNNPTTLFGAYKMFEFTLNGFACDIEEYCHTNYFITDENRSVVFIAPDEYSLNRIIEIEPVVREEIKAKTIILVNEDLKYKAGPNSIPISSPIETCLCPIVYAIPIEFLSYSLARSKGFNTNTFRGGQDTEKYVTGSFKTIRQSKLRY